MWECGHEGLEKDMKLHRLESAPPAWLGTALEEFERQFCYPLGEDSSFHVAHGRQYVAFFQAMGEAVLFVIERAGEVLGTVVVIRRKLCHPDGGESFSYYVCDLKIARIHAGGTALVRLMHAVRNHVLAMGLAPVYGVVMDGTARLPTHYTGRVTIPAFLPLAHLALLSVPTSRHARLPLPASCQRAGSPQVELLRKRLQRGAWSVPSALRELRSEMKPVPLALAYQGACGVVEDTRLGKRLVMADGQEMMSAHLSSFACEDAASGLELIEAARVVAAEHGFPSLFVSLPRTKGFAGLIQTLVVEHGALDAPATIYGTGFPASANAGWFINTAEI